MSKRYLIQIFVSTLTVLTDVRHGFEHSFQENFRKSRLHYFISLNHSQPILYDPFLSVLPTLQVINNATGKQIIGRHVLTSGEYYLQPNQTIKSPPKVNIKQFNTLEAKRQSAASRINKKMARKIQVCNAEFRKLQKAEYQFQTRLESVKKTMGKEERRVQMRART